MPAFDLRSGILPFAFLEIRRCFKEISPGSSIAVICGDAAALDDLLRILPENSCDAVQRSEPGDDDGTVRVVLMKKA